MDARPCLSGEAAAAAQALDGRKKCPSSCDGGTLRGISDSVHSPYGSNRAAEYTSMADDATMSALKREASILYSAAELRLEQGDAAACLSVAKDALAKFRALGEDGRTEVADTLHLMVDGHRLDAYMGYREPAEGERLAEEELAKFRESGEERGEATMLLALAEIRSDDARWHRRQEGLEPVAKALTLAKVVGDKKLEAKCLLESAFIHFTTHDVEQMLEDANSALALFEELKDDMGRAKALHMVGLSYVRVNDWETAMKKATEAKDIFGEIGKKRFEASVLHAMSVWRLIEEKPKKAIVLAEQALDICREMEKGQRAEAVVTFTICEAAAEAKNAKSALKLARQMLGKFQEDGSLKEQAIVHQALTLVHLAQDAPKKALKASQLAQQYAEQLGEKRWESQILLEMAGAHLHADDVDGAHEALEQSIRIAKSEDDLAQLTVSQRELAYFYMFVKKDYESAMHTAGLAVDSAQLNDDKIAEAMATLYAAFCHSLMEDVAKAVSACDDAREMYREASLPWGEAHALGMFAELKAMEGKHEEAVEAAEERLSIARKMKNTKLEAKALGMIAGLHFKAGDSDAAEAACKEAQLLSRDAEDAEGEVQILLLSTQIYLSQIPEAVDSARATVISKAVRAATEAVAGAAKVGEKSLRGTALYWKAQVLLMAEKFPDSQRTAGEAEALFRGLQNEQGQGACLHLIGNLQVISRQSEQALNTFDRALALAQAAGDADLEYEVAQSIHNIQSELQPKQAEGAAAAQAAVVAMPSEGAGEGAAAASAVVAAPKGLDPAFVRKQLFQFCKDVMASEEELELDSPFMEAGLDSLASVSLMSMVAKEFQMALSPSLVFDFPTVRAMEDHLVEESKYA